MKSKNLFILMCCVLLLAIFAVLGSIRTKHKFILQSEKKASEMMGQIQSARKAKEENIGLEKKVKDLTQREKILKVKLPAEDDVGQVLKQLLLLAKEVSSKENEAIQTSGI